MNSKGQSVGSLSLSLTITITPTLPMGLQRSQIAKQKDTVAFIFGLCK